MYIYIVSSQSDHLYSTNRPWAFTAKLPHSLQLPANQYECALIEIRIQSEAANNHGLCLISTDLVGSSMCYSNTLPVLTTLELHSTQDSYVHTILCDPRYSKVTKNRTEDIRFEIATAPGQLNNHLHQGVQKVWLVLHIRPLFNDGSC